MHVLPGRGGSNHETSIPRFHSCRQRYIRLSEPTQDRFCVSGRLQSGGCVCMNSNELRCNESQTRLGSRQHTEW